jgi:hypothetical protein
MLGMYHYAEQISVLYYYYCTKNKNVSQAPTYNYPAQNENVSSGSRKLLALVLLSIPKRILAASTGPGINQPDRDLALASTCSK